MTLNKNNSLKCIKDEVTFGYMCSYEGLKRKITNNTKSRYVKKLLKIYLSTVTEQFHFVTTHLW